jgi:Arc/MetJ-type ribon-helix-helix transcriptional regulator
VVTARADIGHDEMALNRCIAKRYAERMAQLVTRISEELAAQVDELVAGGVVESRSAAVRLGLLRIVDEHRRRRIGDAIVAGYRDLPQTPSDIGWPDEATVAMIAEEPW